MEENQFIQKIERMVEGAWSIEGFGVRSLGF